ncbi:MAG: LysR substrate-binding domain-containing protein [Bulleidia sp.]
MKYEDVMTFVQAYDSGSIAAASRRLYISQGTASTRVASLEQELGFPLLYRKPGIRRTVLTPQGEEFLPIARRWLNLVNDARQIASHSHTTVLKVAATDMINTDTLLPLYETIMHDVPDIRLSVRTHHSSEIHRLLDHQDIDLGLCINLYPYRDIITTPLYREQLVLVTHQLHPYVLSHDIHDLETTPEIHQTYSNETENWYHRTFPDAQPVMMTGTVSMTTRLLNTVERWSIMPESAAAGFLASHPDHMIHHFTDHPAPYRTTCLLACRNPKPGSENAIAVFTSMLKDYLRKKDGIEMIL